MSRKTCSSIRYLAVMIFGLVLPPLSLPLLGKVPRWYLISGLVTGVTIITTKSSLSDMKRPDFVYRATTRQEEDDYLDEFHRTIKWWIVPPRRRTTVHFKSQRLKFY